MNSLPPNSQAPYDLTHLDDVKFGAERILSRPFPTNQLFFGFLAAVLLPGGALIVPIGFMCWNFLELRLKAHAIAAAVSTLILSLGFYLYPEPTLRKVLTIVFSLGLMFWQLRKIHHAVLVGKAEIRETKKIQQLMVIYFVIAFLSFTSVWTWLVNKQINNAINKLNVAQTEAERDSAALQLIHFDGEIRELFGRTASFVLREQSRAAQQAELRSVKELYQKWLAFNIYVHDKTAAGMKAAEKEGRGFKGLDSPISVTEFLKWELQERGKAGQKNE
jgi:hypothetical protein